MAQQKAKSKSEVTQCRNVTRWGRLCPVQPAATRKQTKEKHANKQHHLILNSRVTCLHEKQTAFSSQSHFAKNIPNKNYEIC